MSANTFNLDVISKARNALAALEQIPAEVKKGTDSYAEAARITNSPKLIATAEKQSEASDKFVQSVRDLTERAEAYVNHYKNLEDTV